MFTQRKYYYPYISPFDPCRPIEVKSYETPPQLYIGFQPPSLPQYESPKEALYRGTLWPALYSPYRNPYERGDEQQ
ncbi:spore coat associated protein CotJA [Aquibacillus sp. 3ASR75-11]|uniref:Spore coat associated protein CotJA n=1 Tax=Terrihalobacillus insolitus TaxID=2950438 RepID=A0A9X3WV70_9BACI|nr:spore coat associated protein CotJA [Terrihalobacillus insolitus]MDC3413079.1 spore coat associated protein CotJA [Terrihalobacillus insolitus]MDC3424821.1 spore coat associated protein CotJA [Terrihalobacillus insolitus]